MSAKSVMIIEDDEGSQFYLSVLLNKIDPSLHVIQAYDGQEATFFLAEFQDPPATIFLDINMPIMNGFQFLKENQDVIDSKEIDIVVLTSSESQTDKDAMNEFDCIKGYLMKPVDAADIRDYLAS